MQTATITERVIIPKKSQYTNADKSLRYDVNNKLITLSFSFEKGRGSQDQIDGGIDTKNALINFENHFDNPSFDDLEYMGALNGVFDDRRFGSFELEIGNNQLTMCCEASLIDILMQLEIIDNEFEEYYNLIHQGTPEYLALYIIGEKELGIVQFMEIELQEHFDLDTMEGRYEALKKSIGIINKMKGQIKNPDEDYPEGVIDPDTSDIDRITHDLETLKRVIISTKDELKEILEREILPNGEPCTIFEELENEENQAAWESTHSNLQRCYHYQNRIQSIISTFNQWYTQEIAE